jgi:hypothetical protein
MVGLFAFLAAPAVMAQPSPAGNPKCGSVAGLMHHSLANQGNGATGRNFVSVQRVSPVHANAEAVDFNGYSRLCARMGMPQGVPTDVDGDATPDNATLTQFDPANGTVNSVQCQFAVPAVQWDEGAAVEITPDLTNSSSVSLIVPGVECSQRYAVYERGNGALGVNYFPIPLSTTCVDRNCLCTQLNLPDGTNIQTIDAANGFIESLVCNAGNPPIDVSRVPLPIGEAARIEPPGNVTAGGAPLNCLSGLPCPAAPSNDYPEPLVY